jgi:hypothetical protein
MRAGWIWGIYALSLAWVGLLFVHAERYVNSARALAFDREGRRLVAVWADRMGEAKDDPSRAKLLRRFAGEMDSRSTALLNEQGQLLHAEGESPPPFPRLPTSESIGGPLDDKSWAYLTPLWEAGRRKGFLVWIRDSSALPRERSRVQRGLLAAWAWWAAAGAAGAVFAGRPRPPA